MESALQQIYGEQIPFFYGVTIAFADGGPDPLDGIAIYFNDTGPHFHYVSTGLYERSGFELTFRLRARPEQRGTEPDVHLGSIAYNAPTWPIQMLNMLARRVLRTRRPFRHGDWWEGQPGIFQPHADFRHLVFANDPQLGIVAVPGRDVAFVLAAAATAETIAAMQRDEEELARLLRDNPLLISG